MIGCTSKLLQCGRYEEAPSQDDDVDVQREIHQNDNLSLLTNNLSVLVDQEAAEIYRNIVRTLRDPALLEYAGYGVFKARIFPIEPKSDRKIELSYAQILKYQEDDFKFVYPIRQAGIEKSDNFYLSLL